MQNPQEFYSNQKAIFEQKSTQLKNKLTVSSLLRFITFLTIILGIYLFLGNISAMLLVVGVGIMEPTRNSPLEQPHKLSLSTLR